MYWETIKDFELSGFRFRLSCQQDDDMGAPWEEHDGHGPVRMFFDHYARYPTKKPGERVLSSDRGEFLLYDWQEAVRIAKRDGWGINPDRRAEWETRIGRPLTRGMIAEAAVKDDFDHLRRYCRGDWCWLCIRVELLDVEDEPVDGFVEYLGGIDSDSSDYLESEGENLAGEIVRQVKATLGRKKILELKHGARVERIRLRV